MQGIFYSKDRPQYLNYGVLGSFIGHELTHSLDIFGAQLDKEGNLVDWWRPDSKKEYIKRAQCVVKQYDNYTVKDVGLKVNLSSSIIFIHHFHLKKNR